MKGVSYRRSLLGIAALAMALVVPVITGELGAAFAQSGEPQTYEFDMPPQPLADALRAVGSKAGVNIAFDPSAVRGKRAPELRGTYTVEEAVRRLIEGTALNLRRTDGGSLLISERGPPPREAAVAMPQIMVERSRLLNMDIARSRDDAQPYVVFDREVIERSGAVSVEDFLKQRLPMNTSAGTNNQGAGLLGNISQINLRGLGTNQTLILIDGHRMPSLSNLGTPLQTDLNGIPTGAIERIEVLPTTSSGIYGGSATGGVINVILRRDYQGLELRAAYENTFSTDTAIRRGFLSGGFNLEGGKTNVLVGLGYSDANWLLAGDRDFISRGRAAILINNPATFFSATTPPLGSTPNIRSTNGTNLTLRGGTALNSPVTFVPIGYAGPASDNGAALAANAGHYNLEQAGVSQNGAGGRNQTLLNSPTIESALASIRRDFTPALSGFVDGFYVRNRTYSSGSQFGTSFNIAANARNNPFNQAITVAVPTATVSDQLYAPVDEYRAMTGVIARLPAKWMAEADYSWNRTSYSFSLAPTLSAAATTSISNGTIDVLRDTTVFPLDLSPFVVQAQLVSPFKATLKDTSVRFSGPVGSLPGGEPTVTMLLERRDEVFSDGFNYSPVGTFYSPGRSQTISSAYAEARVPIVSQSNRLPGVYALEVQAAGRSDQYKLNGATNSVLLSGNTVPPINRVSSTIRSSNPTLGLRYQPSRDLAIRASYGTGFFPPTVNQILASQVNFQNIIDPRRGSATQGLIPGLTGGNTGLRPEESKSWSTGFILSPGWIDGFRLSVDYTHIEKTDNINTVPGGVQGLVNNEALFPGRVIRGPAAPGDAFGVGPITFIDNTSINIARNWVDAYDVAADYHLEVPTVGAFDLNFLGTWQPHFRTQLISTAAITEGAGVSSANPLRFRGNASLAWRQGHWDVTWLVRYFDSYVVSTTPATILNQGGNGRVPSQTYHDVFVRYAHGPVTSATRASRMLGEWEIRVGVKNIFNRKPPFDAGNTVNFYSPYGDPRLAAYYVELKTAF